MCGIIGFAGQGSADALRKMSVAIRRRGPDDEGFYEAPGVGFAFRRLSIIDVAGGHQPLANEDGSVWVMLNGEIYGYAAVRDELAAKGHVFKTRSDTEVIAHAYEEWGDACWERLNGMFAVALWDAKKSRLVLARDRLGKKPLYWTERGGTIWFASELKALLAAGAVERRIDPIALGMYFRTDAVPTPRSIFEGVQKLQPASAMSWTAGSVEKNWSFWKCPSDELEIVDSQEIIAGLRERIDRAVAERLVSDVPLGLFVSGGLDSAVIAESAARQAKAMLQAFTIGFEDASHDERWAARKVAEALGLEHREEVLSSYAALSMLDEATELLDEPLADPSILPQLLLSRFTRREVTVALSGDGGDELLLGYQHVPAHIAANRLPSAFGRALSPLMKLVPAGGGYFSFGFKAQRLARGLKERDPWARDLAWRGAVDRDTLASLLVSDVRAQVEVGAAERHLAERALEAGEDAPFWRAWSWAYLRTFLMDEVMVKVDRATMWFALESRAPLLDSRVAEYLLRVPDRFKLGAWKGKRLFKELLRGRIPSDVLERPKHGFAVPVAEWLRGPLHAELEDFADEAFVRRQGWFEPSAVRRLLTEHLEHKQDRRKELWAYLMFQRWHKRWMS